MSPADTALRRVIATSENAFPDRIRGYYVHGSVADNTSIATSDVDLDVVVKGGFTDPEEHVAFVQAARAIAASRDLEVDIDVTDEASLFDGAETTFKLGSRLLHGEDIRARVPLLSIDQWGRERMYRGYFLLLRVFHRPSRVRYPIGFPDPDAEFFGYADRRVSLGDGTDVPSTRDLMRVTGWLATALIAHEGKQYVAVPRLGCTTIVYVRSPWRCSTLGVSGRFCPVSLELQPAQYGRYFRNMTEPGPIVTRTGSIDRL